MSLVAEKVEILRQRHHWLRHAISRRLDDDLDLMDVEGPYDDSFVEAVAYLNRVTQLKPMPERFATSAMFRVYRQFFNKTHLTGDLIDLILGFTFFVGASWYVDLRELKHIDHGPPCDAESSWESFDSIDGRNITNDVKNGGTMELCSVEEMGTNPYMHRNYFSLLNESDRVERTALVIKPLIPGDLSIDSKHSHDPIQLHLVIGTEEATFLTHKSLSQAASSSYDLDSMHYTHLVVAPAVRPSLNVVGYNNMFLDDNGETVDPTPHGTLWFTRKQFHFDLVAIVLYISSQYP
jgi:hypothetical protein